MKNLRIGSCADDKGFLVDKNTNETVRCAFDLTKFCYSTCAACDMRGYIFCMRGEKEFQIGVEVKED